LTLTLLKESNAYSALVFTRTKHRADRVARQIKQAGYKVATLHSNKSQNQRQQALDGFRSGKVHVLVATDIAARGIDVATITHVINYDIPDTPDAYIHRIGRTGRVTREGDAMTLITGEDSSIVRDIERTLGRTIERRTVQGFDYKQPAPPRDSQSTSRPGQPKPRAAQPEPVTPAVRLGKHAQAEKVDQPPVASEGGMQHRPSRPHRPSDWSPRRRSYRH
jgi:ATP-dependent RNA helicase RhlE